MRENPSGGPATAHIVLNESIKNATLVPSKGGDANETAFIERHGGPEVLKFGQMPDPVVASGEVLIDIVAASVNGADWKVREGKSGQLTRFPYILGGISLASFQPRGWR